MLFFCVLHNSAILNLTRFAVATAAKVDSSTLRDLFSRLYFVYQLEHEIPCSAAQTGTFCPAQQSAVSSSSRTDAPIHAPLNGRGSQTF